MHTACWRAAASRAAPGVDDKRDAAPRLQQEGHRELDDVEHAPLAHAAELLVHVADGQRGRQAGDGRQAIQADDGRLRACVFTSWVCVCMLGEWRGVTLGVCLHTVNSAPPARLTTSTAVV
jgi:hypothetical protein